MKQVQRRELISDELLSLVKLIVNSMNGTNVLITADHGFLYSYQPLTESDKSEKSLVSGTVIKADRRCMVTEPGASSKYLMQVPMKAFDSDKLGFAPLETFVLR